MSLQMRFTYATGIADDLFDKATLHGSWDAAGSYSDRWTSQSMDKIAGPDGCPAFTATVDLQPAHAGQTFEWGVSLDGPRGKGAWAITTEEHSASSSRRHRSFAVTGGEAVALSQTYYLNQSRLLGAQKHAMGERPAIRFSVWAPNARDVQVFIGNLWPRGGDPRVDSLVDRTKTPAMESSDRHAICGGYIHDGGDDDPGVYAGWQPFAMVREADGVWSTDPRLEALRDFAKLDHLPYMFRVVKDNGRVAFRADPYSRCQIGYGDTKPHGHYTGATSDLDGTVSCSVVVDPDRVTALFRELPWPETQWVSQEAFFSETESTWRPKAPRLQDLVIYELHLGALGFHRGAGNPGTLEDAYALIDHLEALGVNAVELLPLSEFGGEGSGWGYATSHYLAIEYSGGGRDQYKWFIRECHRRGIAVILDVVYNHYSHDAERAQWMFDTDSHEKNVYYWYEGRPDDYGEFDRNVRAERRGQGGYVDNLSSGWAPRYCEERVRGMFVSSAVALAAEFRIDGFRVDQTTSIRSYNSLHANGRPLEHANAFGAKLIRELTRTLRFVNPQIMLMAEDHDNWSGVTDPLEAGGLGFDAVWYADFYHHLIGDTEKGSDYGKLIKNAGYGDDRPLRMDYFAGALQATQGGRRIVYHESHDEAGNGKLTERTIRVAVNDAPLSGETRAYAEARCRFAAGVTLLSAGVPMFLFGEEVGVEKPFLYNHVLENREDLVALSHGSGRHIFEFYRQIIRLRLRHPGLRSPEIDVLFVHNEHRLLVFRRWGGGEDFLVFASLNNRAFDAPCYVFHADRLPAGAWKEIFNSDATDYGGRGIGNMGRVVDCPGGRIECVVPSNGLVVFQRI